MPLSVVLENAGQNENINYGFDDYLLVRESWLGGKITIYPAFLSGNYKVFYCRGCGKSVALPRDPAGSGVE